MNSSYDQQMGALQGLFGNPLIQLGTGILAANGPGVSGSQAVGLGVTNMLQQQIARQALAAKAQQAQMQAAALAMKIKQQEAQQEALQRLFGGASSAPSYEDLSGAGSSPPAAALGMAGGQMPDVVAGGSAAPMGGFAPSAAMPAQPAPGSAPGGLNMGLLATAFPNLGMKVLENQMIPPESVQKYQWMLQHPEEAAKLKAMGLVGPSKTQVTVQNVGEREFNKEFGKYSAKQYEELINTVKAQRQRLQMYKDLDKLLEGKYTGAGGEIMTQVQKWARLAGVDVGNVGPKEAALSIAHELALQLRNPAGGAGMPGAMSDKDREFLQSIPPGLETTATGRKMLLRTQERVYKRSREYLKWAREYRKMNGGTFDPDGFEEYAAQKAKESPLFNDLAAELAKMSGKMRSKFEAANAIIERY